jgi:hypothetical protein
LNTGRAEARVLRQKRLKSGYWTRLSKQIQSTAFFCPKWFDPLIPLNPDVYLRSLEEFSPEIIRQPENVNTYVGMPVFFSVAAVGNNLKYQWYRNGQKIENATDPEIRSLAVKENNDCQFYAVVENIKGITRSGTAQLKAIPYVGPDLVFTKSAPVIDGNIDSVWIISSRLPVNKPVMGRIGNPGDLEGVFSTMYDAVNLYFLFEIKDDSLVNNRKERYMNDGIEIYLDTDNDKPEFYSGKEYMIRIIRDKPHAYIERGEMSGEVRMKQVNFPEKYIAEIAIPWSEIGKFSGEFIGLEIQISDNDLIERDTKLSWYGDSDEVYRSPMNFGVMRVAK